MGGRSCREERGAAGRAADPPGYRRTWSAATLKDMARVPHVREFIDLIAARPPFRQCAPPHDGGAAQKIARFLTCRHGPSTL